MAQPTQVAQPTQAAPADASRYLPLLLVLFAGSGCSALIYETVWYQLLQLAIGSTAVSLGFLLATFMGGLCIGSVWFPRLRLAGRHPLRIYAFLELGIAASAILVHLLLPLVNMAYIAGAEHGMPYNFDAQVPVLDASGRPVSARCDETCATSG